MIKTRNKGENTDINIHVHSTCHIYECLQRNLSLADAICSLVAFSNVFLIFDREQYSLRHVLAKIIQINKWQIILFFLFFIIFVYCRKVSGCVRHLQAPDDFYNEHSRQMMRITNLTCGVLYLLGSIAWRFYALVFVS